MTDLVIVRDYDAERARIYLPVLGKLVLHELKDIRPPFEALEPDLHRCTKNDIVPVCISPDDFIISPRPGRVLFCFIGLWQRKGA